MNEQTRMESRFTPIPQQPSRLRQERSDAVGQATGFEPWTERLPDADVRYQPTQDRNAPAKVKLWDAVDGTWTRPLDESHVYKYYLKKGVHKCSACTFADHRPGSVVKHIENLNMQMTMHRDATIERHKVSDDIIGLVCSACGITFINRPSLAHSHFLDVEEDVRHHVGAISQVIRRFSLEPVELPRPLVAQATNGRSDPAGTGVGEELRVRSVHKRKRGKRGGRKHG